MAIAIAYGETKFLCAKLGIVHRKHFSDQSIVVAETYAMLLIRAIRKSASAFGMRFGCADRSDS